MNAHAHLTELVGQELRTVSGRSNRILGIDGGDVIVATTRSPHGARVRIAWAQEAMDQFERDGEIAIDVATVCYWSAFIGAVLSTLPGAFVLPTSPPRIKLENLGG
jgi:hypothetical protein